MNVMHYPLLNNEDFNPFVFRKTNILKQLIKAWCTLSQNFPKLIDNSTKCLNFQPQLHFMVLKKFSIQHTIKVSESEYFRIRLSKFSRLCKTLFNILKNCMYLSTFLQIIYNATAHYIIDWKLIWWRKFPLIFIALLGHEFPRLVEILVAGV